MTDNLDRDTAGLHRKYEVRKDGEAVEDCFVLEPEDDPAARVALKAYASATQNDELAEDLREEYDLKLSPTEVWELHNEPFRYEPPDLPGDMWSSEQYQELHDRCINRRVQWFCQQCSGTGPIGTLEKARRHVESNHGRKLVEKHATPREEDTLTDGGREPSETRKRESENHGLAEFSGGDE